MKRSLNLMVCLLLAIAANGQILQPKWMFPICFEDAEGNKDTLKIGYDTRASNGSNYDSLFENYILIDTTKFNVSFGGISEYMVKKQDVAGWEIENNCYGIAISFTKGKMPLTMSWDDALFYSDSLPYIGTAGYPKARAEFYCSNGEGPLYPNCPIDATLVMTDHPNIAWPFTASHSFTFQGSGSVPVNECIFGMVLEIREYSYNLIKIREEKQKEKSNIVVSNIGKNRFLIKSDESVRQYSVYSAEGKKIQTKDNLNQKEFEIEVSGFSTAMFFLLINRENDFQKLKLIYY